MATTTVSLGHIKDKREDGREPWDEVPAEPVKRRRIAWPGGKITSNKDEALVAYLSKKLQRGEALTDVQRAAFDTATKGTRFEGKSEAEAMEFAAAERKALPAAAPAPAAAKAKKDGKRGGGRGGGAKGKGGGRGKGAKGKGRGNGGKPSGARPAKKPTLSKPKAVPLTKRIDGGLSTGR